MIDNLKSAAKQVGLFPMEDEKPNFITIKQLKFTGIRSLKNFEIIKYQCQYKNLLLTLNERELIVTNSLHKLIKGNNYSDFRFSELMSAVNEIESITGISASEFKIRKLEFAINITVPIQATDYLTKFSDYKGREFDKMRDNQLWYGIKYIFTEYCLKIYDKSRQVKIADRIDINQNILRFEVVYNSIRKLSTINNLAELKDLKKINQLFSQFISIIKKINCIGNEDFTNFQNAERERYFAGQNPEYWKSLKSHNINTYKTNKKRYIDIQNKVNAKDLSEDFENDLTVKFNHLINS